MARVARQEENIETHLVQAISDLTARLSALEDRKGPAGPGPVIEREAGPGIERRLARVEEALLEHQHNAAGRAGLFEPLRNDRN